MTERLRLDAQNPWPGLATFAESDQKYFRGRARESDELARLVRRERLTVLFGRSGLGKSSLLNAGLFPCLREDLHLPVYLRIGYAAAASPRQQVWDALNAACAAGGVKAMPPEPDESLWAYFHRAGAGFWNPRRRPLLPVLVFDQFEEMFTLGQLDDTRRAAAEAFAEELADLIEDRPSESLREQLDTDPALGEHIDFERRGCKVLLSFREDFLAEVEGLRDRMPSLMRNRFRLLPMDGAQALEVIGSGGALVGAGVADRIIGLAWRNRAEAPAPEEADRIEVDPALLSVICSELNQRRLASGAATIEHDLLAGAEREILVDFYERSLQGLDPGVRHFVEDELITAGGYRDSCAYDDALARPGVTHQALERLVAGRLLGVDERFGVRRLELTHDVMTRVVMDSRDKRREREAREQAQREAKEAERRLRRSRRFAVAMTMTTLVAIGLLGLTVDAYNWATKNSFPPDSMLMLQRFRLGFWLGIFEPVPEMVDIPAGKFDMGEQDREFVKKLDPKDHKYFEIPGMKGVEIAAAFKVGKHEVTYDQFDYYVWQQHRAGYDKLVFPITARGERGDRPVVNVSWNEATASDKLVFPVTAKGGRGDRPVVNVSWNEATAYAKWLGEHTHQRCSLPTEAEWEYAARAGKNTAYPWGNEVGEDKANCKGCGRNPDNDQSTSVGSFSPNAFDLYDTAGNVWEWTCSAWREKLDGRSETQCVTAEQDHVDRVVRGGSWLQDADKARSAARLNWDAVDHGSHDVGFRVLCLSAIE